MNITVLLGNGFDIGLEMPTRYEDFYREYCVVSAEDNDNICSFKEMLKERNKEEKKRIIDWSDFEKAFGEHSEDFTLEDKRAYLDRFEDFIEKFNAYLEKVESNVDYSDTKTITTTMDKAVRSIINIRAADRNAINAFYNQFNGSRTYNFVVFNYTKTADNCIGILRQHLMKEQARRVGQVVHIHGFVEANMIVGVNDASQITNPEFSKDSEVIREIVKPQQNENSRTAYEAEMIKIINNSDVVCTYGMSIGETDRKWWDYLSEWLSKSTKRILVILIHDKKYNARFPHSQDRFIRPVMEKFLAFSSLADNLKKNIESRIFIGVNNDVFAMNLYRASSKGKVPSLVDVEDSQEISIQIEELLAGNTATQKEKERTGAVL